MIKILQIDKVKNGVSGAGITHSKSEILRDDFRPPEVEFTQGDNENTTFWNRQDDRAENSSFRRKVQKSELKSPEKKMY